MNIFKTIGLSVMTMVVVTKANDKVYLGDVKSLTFQRGAMTVGGGRTPPIQQMNCVGGTGAGYSHVHPSTIQCENRGSDGNDIQWECKGELLEGFRFGSTMVACEGYSTATDPYIMTGSCGVEYTIERVGGKTTSSGNDYGLIFLFLFIIIMFVSVSCDKPTGGYQSRRYGDGSSNFWPGAAAGYMAGSYSRNRGSGWGGGVGGGGGGGTHRMATGFGGTRRR